MSKEKLCKLVKTDGVNQSWYSMVFPAKSLCRKCGRAASKKTYLCKPISKKELKI